MLGNSYDFTPGDRLLVKYKLGIFDMCSYVTFINYENESSSIVVAPDNRGNQIQKLTASAFEIWKIDTLTIEQLLVHPNESLRELGVFRAQILQH